MIAVLDEPQPITLEVHICDQRRSYLASFSTEDQAIDFIGRKGSTHAFFQVDDAPIGERYTRLLDTLYPDCEHGLSAWLCAGPEHYPSDRY